MIGKRVILLLVVGLSLSTAQSTPNCQLAFDFLLNVDYQLFNNATALKALASQLNVAQSNAAYGLQYILYNYYGPQYAADANSVVFDKCSAVFKAQVANALVNAGLNAPSEWVANAPTTCQYAAGTDLTLNPQTGVFSWPGGSVNLAPAGESIFQQMKIELAKPVYNSGNAILSTCSQANWLAQQFVQSQLGLAYCSLNDWLFSAVDQGLNWPAALSAISAQLSIPSSANTLSGLVSAYLNTAANKAPAADFIASCDKQINRLIGDFLVNTIGLSSISSSSYLSSANASSVGGQNTCSGSAYTFSMVGQSLVWTAKVGGAKGSINLAPVLGQVAGVLSYQASTTQGQTFASLVNQRVAACASSPLGVHLVNDVFGAFKGMITSH